MEGDGKRRRERRRERQSERQREPPKERQSFLVGSLRDFGFLTLEDALERQRSELIQ